MILANQQIARAVELGARWYVFLFLNVYGLGKILGGQFYRRGHLPPDVAQTTLGQVGSFELAWTFMGHSKAYILFIGISQIIGAWLLLGNRTKLLGVGILFPILVNVVVFDLIFLDAYGALASAVIYTSMLVLIVILNRDRVLDALQALVRAVPEERPGGVKLVLTALLLMAALFAFDQALVNWFGHGKS